VWIGDAVLQGELEHLITGFVMSNGSDGIQMPGLLLGARGSRWANETNEVVPSIDLCGRLATHNGHDTVQSRGLGNGTLALPNPEIGGSCVGRCTTRTPEMTSQRGPILEDTHPFQGDVLTAWIPTLRRSPHVAQEGCLEEDVLSKRGRVATGRWLALLPLTPVHQASVTGQPAGIKGLGILRHGDMLMSR
jgi:hypothetical protein